jgi:hypothetical protein
MTMTRSRQATVALLLSALTVLATWLAAGPATAGGRTVTEEGRANGALWGTDRSTGVEAHGVWDVWATAHDGSFALGDFFLSGDSLGAWECIPDSRTTGRIRGVETAWSAGRLPFTCGHIDTGEAVRGYALVALHWRGEGPVARDSWVQDDCRVTQRIRPAHVSGVVRLVVPGVFTANLRPDAHPTDSIVQTRTVCR